MFKTLLIWLFVLSAMTVQAQHVAAANNDSVGITYIERELRVKITKVSDQLLEITFEKDEDRRTSVAMENMHQAKVGVEPKKEMGVWKIDLSAMYNGTNILLIYDFDANKVAHIKVSRKGKHRKTTVFAVQ